MIFARKIFQRYLCFRANNWTGFRQKFFDKLYFIPAPFGYYGSDFNAPLWSLLGIYNIAVKLVNWFFAFAVLIGIAMMIMAGLEYITASRTGDKDKAGAAKSRIVWVIIGMVVVFLAWLIITRIIPDLIGIDAPNINPDQTF